MQSFIREARSKRVKDLCILRRPRLQWRQSSVKARHQDLAGAWRCYRLAMHRSFVGSPSLCEGLRFLRMTRCET